MTERESAPAYDFETFRKACGENEVFIYKEAEIKDEAKKLKLFTAREILLYLAEPLDGLRFINAKPLEANLFKSQGNMVDSYYFGFDVNTWYFAFLQTVSHKWVLKSFKPSNVFQHCSKQSVLVGGQLGKALESALKGKE